MRYIIEHSPLVPSKVAEDLLHELSVLPDGTPIAFGPELMRHINSGDLKVISIDDRFHSTESSR
jgi:hypothetical protein